MKGQVALVREQGQHFAVLLVKSSAIDNPARRDQLLELGRTQFGVRTALLGEDGDTFGPRDIVRWLRGVHPSRLPWREFTLGGR